MQRPLEPRGALQPAGGAQRPVPQLHGGPKELRGLYQRLGAELPGNGWSSTSQNGDLAFRLVESLVSLRADGLSTPDSPLQAADAGIVLCGLADSLAEIRVRSAALMARIG